MGLTRKEPIQSMDRLAGLASGGGKKVMPDSVGQADIEKDLRSCMRCKFFYKGGSQCLAKKCVGEDRGTEGNGQDREDMCFGCPYQQSEQYCFPCMRKLLGRKGKEIRKEVVLGQEEKRDG